jgi:hypothetical protein
VVTSVAVVGAKARAAARRRLSPARRARLPIALLEHRLLRGCNLHHTTTVLRQRVDLGELAGLHTQDAGRGFAARFIRRFVGLDENRPNGHMSVDFLVRLKSASGVPVEEALFEAILAVDFSIRQLAKADHAEVVHSADARLIDLVWSTRVPSLSRASARVALAGFLELLPQRLRQKKPRAAKNFEARLDALRKRARRKQWSSSAAMLRLAAEKQGLPCESLGDDYLLVGQGIEQHVVYAPAASKGGPDLAASRIPIALIVGQRRTSAIASDLDGLLRAAGKAVGLAAPKRTTVGGKPLQERAAQRRDAARFLLHDPRVGVLVTTASPRRIVRRGLRVDRCSVAAIADSARTPDGETFEQGIAVALKATEGLVVVRADRAHTLVASEALDPKRLAVCSLRENGVVRRHVARGGLAVVRVSRDAEERIELQRAGETIASVPGLGVRSGSRGRRRRQTRARMFAIALAFGLGLSPQEIVAAVERRRYLHP